jgi:transmembrane sensor
MDRIRQLILLYLREELSIAERQELEVWLEADPRHPTFLADMQDADGLAVAFGKLDRLDGEKVRARLQAYAEEQQQQEEQPGTVIRMRRMRRVFSVAAAIIILLAGTYFWTRYKKAVVTQPATAQVHDVQPGGNKAILTLSGGRRVVLDSSREDTVLTEGAAVVAGSHGRLAYKTGTAPASELVYNTLTTPRGGEYQLTLPDGTRVWLNAASSITYPTSFTKDQRKVTITGEAYFEVAKDPQHPFIVRLPALTKGNHEDGSWMDVEVLGTSFNINAYGDEVAAQTTLVEGSVKVIGSGSQKIIAPGEQTAVVFGVPGIQVDKHADVAQALAWKNGLFAFNNADLPTVMRQLSRWYNVDVNYEGNIPKDQFQFNGKIGKSLTLDQVLKILTKTQVHYTIDGYQLTIRP